MKKVGEGALNLRHDLNCTSTVYALNEKNCDSSKVLDVLVSLLFSACFGTTCEEERRG